MRIAILDDDPAELQFLRNAIAVLGHEAHGFSSGQALQRELRRESFDLVLLDWQVPDLSGPEVLRWMRDHLQHRVPVMFVTNRDDERDIVEALALGADDFMVKPVRLGEFLARVKALLRRSYPPPAPGIETFGPYTFDVRAQTLSVNGAPVVLKQKEYELALLLFRNQGRLLSRQHLIETVWNIEPDASWRSLDTHISKLRVKLQLRPHNGYLLTSVYSHGYRLEALQAPTLPSEPDGEAHP